MSTTTFEQIDEQAKASARDLLAQGWEPSEATYDLGMYHGDLEALEERLGRKATRDERIELESSIRMYLREGA